LAQATCQARATPRTAKVRERLTMEMAVLLAALGVSVVSGTMLSETCARPEKMLPATMGCRERGWLLDKAHASECLCNATSSGSPESQRMQPPGLSQLGGTELFAEPGAWLISGFLADAEADHLLSLAPANSSKDWGPCSYELEGTHCALVQVDPDDEHVRAVFAKVEVLWGVKMPVSPRGVWLPMLHYAPGTSAVGAHSDRYQATDGKPSDDGPDVSMVFYLSNTPERTARTVFPTKQVKVQPRRGSVLTWMNVDFSTGLAHPDAVHAVEAVPKDSPDRYALSIPVKLFDLETGCWHPRVRMDYRSQGTTSAKNKVIVAGWMPATTTTTTTASTTTATTITTSTTTATTTTTTATTTTTSTTTATTTTTPTTTATTTATSTTTTTTTTSTLAVENVGRPTSTWSGVVLAATMLLRLLQFASEASWW